MGTLYNIYPNSKRCLALNNWYQQWGMPRLNWPADMLLAHFPLNPVGGNLEMYANAPEFASPGGAFDNLATTPPLLTQFLKGFSGNINLF